MQRRNFLSAADPGFLNPDQDPHPDFFIVRAADMSLCPGHFYFYSFNSQRP